MKTALLAALVLAVAIVAVAPAADADPIAGNVGPCEYYITTSAGYVACCPVTHVSVAYGGTYMCV